MGKCLKNVNSGKRLLQKFIPVLALIIFAQWSFAANANNSLEDLVVTSLPDNHVQITLKMAKPAPKPLTFTVDRPARIAMDFPGVTSNLKSKRHTIELGMVQSAIAVEANGRTRVVLNLVSMVPYKTEVQGNEIRVLLQGRSVAAAAAASNQQSQNIRQITSQSTQNNRRPAAKAKQAQVNNVDFRRGGKGEGRIVVALSDPSAPVDVRREGSKLVAEFVSLGLPNSLRKVFDVTDFATPVTTIEAQMRGNNAVLVIDTQGDYEHLAYQTEGLLTLEVRPLTQTEIEKKKEKFRFVGERLSLNFQNIEVRAVLQIIADFTELNMVVSDTVQGSITMRLQNVPWDQALELILKTNGLGQRRDGNVILVAPAQEIAAREKAELESKKQVEDLEPLQTELIQINYGKATDIAEVLKNKDSSLLTGRATVTVDERTNQLLLRETASNLNNIRRLVKDLDKPVRQVLIESRVVIANSDFNRELGVRFGVTSVQENGSDGVIALGANSGTTDSIIGSAADNINTTGQPFPVTIPDVDGRYNVNVPTSVSPMGSIAMAILGSDYLLDLELSAMQAEGRGEVVSSPRVVTANQKQATIKSGIEIAYEVATSSGATAVAFKEAVLGLDVTPQITPDNRIILDLKVNKDQPDFSREVRGVPPINKQEVITQVLVDNGETVVLGGVYEQNSTDAVNSVPFFGDLPIIGSLFRHKTKVDSKSELLIFVTPKILSETLGR